MATYPDYAEFRSELAEYSGVAADSICITDGSDQAIEKIIELCSRKKLRVLLPLPTFSGYEIMFNRTDIDQLRIYYTEDRGVFHYPLEETLASMRSGSVGALFLCQPNNPLGTILSAEDYGLILDTARDNNVLVVTDEAYAEFTDSSTVSRIMDQPIFILRTFSKSFGLAGLRVGYVIAQPTIATELSKLLLPWPVSGTSMHYAQLALQHRKSFAERRSQLVTLRSKFFETLSMIKGIVVYASTANFILIRVPHADVVEQHMRKSGIKIALGEKKTSDPRVKSLLSSTIRLSVPSPMHLEEVVRALKEAVDNLDK